MADILFAIVLMCGMTTFFGGILGFLAFLRYLKHKETMALAEKGLIRSERALQPNNENKNTLRWAVMLIAVGFALCLGLYPIGFAAAPGEFPLNLGPWMIVGFLPLFFGMGLLFIYALPALHTLVQRGLPDESTFSTPSARSDATTPTPDEPMNMPQG